MAANRPREREAGEGMVGTAHLTRDVAWVLVKGLVAALKPPDPPPDKAASGDPERAASSTDVVPRSADAIETKIKTAEVAIASALDAKSRALAAVAAAGALADAVKAATDAGEHRVRQATQAGQQQAQREVRDTRNRLDALLALESARAERKVAQWISAVADEAEAEADKIRDEARRAAKLAQRLVDEAHQQMTEARALSAEATAAAAGAAEQARAQAVIAQQAASAPRAIDTRGPETTPARRSAPRGRSTGRRRGAPRLDQHTRAELVELARPLKIGGTSRMTKEQLVQAVRRGSRRKQRS